MCGGQLDVWGVHERSVVSRASVHSKRLYCGCLLPGVEGEYIRTDIVPPFFSKVWLVRNALDRRTAKLLIETVVEIANKAGGSHIIQQIVEDLKDPSEPFRYDSLLASYASVRVSPSRAGAGCDGNPPAVFLSPCPGSVIGALKRECVPRRCIPSPW